MTGRRELPAVIDVDEDDEDDLDDPTDESGVPDFREPLTEVDEDTEEEDLPDDEDDDLSPVPELAVDALGGEPDEPIDDDEIPGVLDEDLNAFDEVEEVDGLAILPWKTTARVPELEQEMPALLDPTRPDTTWCGPDAPEDLRVTIVIGPLRVEVELQVLPEGDEPHLRVGRDVLGGRAVVRC